MFTRKRLPLPILSGDWKVDGPNLLRALNDYFGSLEAKGALILSQAQIYVDQGLQFPSTQVASSDANNLDDYKEGTWTPIDSSGAGLTFTSPLGVYTKVGNLVTAWGKLAYPATANGAIAFIGGLPYAEAGGEAGRGGGMIAFKTESTLATVIVAVGTTTLSLASETGVSIINSTMSGDTIYFCVIYPSA